VEGGDERGVISERGEGEGRLGDPGRVLGDIAEGRDEGCPVHGVDVGERERRVRHDVPAVD